MTEARHQSPDLLTVAGLVKHFPIRKGVFSRVTGHVRAVEAVDLRIARGTTLSLVGESGSGKTTTGRAILRLIEPTAGRVLFDGIDVTAADREELRALRKRMQIIFQDPYGSLNPRMTVYSMIAGILRVHGLARRGEERDRAAALLDRVGLPPDAADRYPHEFSGGQRQRIGIARALAVEPDFIVADEPVSALDVSVQAQILNLLEELQEELGLTYLFIGHDLSVVRHIADHAAVMYLGCIVEYAPVESLFEDPVHPYTRTLLAAAPSLTPRQRKSAGAALPEKTVVANVLREGAVRGCPFRPRCPDAVAECGRRMPPLAEVRPGHKAACIVHAPGEDGAASESNTGPENGLSGKEGETP
jgi:oligopeptide/dipeptide ABC transporter ATP-binding protein